MKTFAGWWVGVLAVAPACAQVDRITEERVRDTVTWLAADERGGRDTGSPGAVEAAEWIAKRFADVGLVPLREGSWTHEFSMAGWKLDSAALKVKLTRRTKDDAGKDDVQTFELVADTDVRQWTAGDATAGDEACTVVHAGDPAAERLLLAAASRRPVLLEVPPEDPSWQRAKGAHLVMSARRQASRPVLLVRSGVLPPSPEDREIAWSAAWSVAAPEKAEVPQHNVLGVIRGAAKRDEYVVVSAHYDHIGTAREVEGDRIANGADDNATGTTAVLLLAEAMAKEPPPARSVLFVCFTAEERMLRGSAAFCERPPIALDKVVANLNFEMLGRPEPGNEGKAWITGAEFSDFAAIAAPALEKGGVELIPFEMATRLFAMSDNWSFAQKGVVAHSLSAGSLHADYHQVGDEVEKLDLAHMTKVIRALHGLVREFADREQPPQWNERGRQRLAGGRGR